MNTIKSFHMSLLQATNVLGAFQRLSGAVMPARFAYIAARNLAALAGNPEVIGAEQTRSKLIRETYGVQGEAGFSVPPEKQDAFHADFATVGAKMVKLKLQVFPAEAIDHFPAITPADLLALEPFIDVEQPETPATKKQR